MGSCVGPLDGGLLDDGWELLPCHAHSPSWVLCTCLLSFHARCAANEVLAHGRAMNCAAYVAASGACDAVQWGPMGRRPTGVTCAPCLRPQLPV
jgi:hypothetical protein